MKKPVKTGSHTRSSAARAAKPNVGGLNLRQGLDTLGAQMPAHQFAVFIDADLLNVWQILAPRRVHRVTAQVAKHRFLAAIFANRHDFASDVLKLTYFNAADVTMMGG
jgi:hypothetical protein